MFILFLFHLSYAGVSPDHLLVFGNSLWRRPGRDKKNVDDVRCARVSPDHLLIFGNHYGEDRGWTKMYPNQNFSHILFGEIFSKSFQ